MENPGLFRKIEIEIDLHAPIMDVRRHRIPHGPLLELRHSDDQLAGLDPIGELKDRSFVRCFQAAEIETLRARDRQQRCRVRTVRGADNR